MENYEVISNIGKGSFGLVSKVQRKSDGKTLVWKEMDYGKMTEKEKQQLVAEVNILRDLNHPHIVRYYDRIIDKKKTKIYLIMEYCEGGDMRTLLRKCKKDKDYIAEDVIWKIFTQILLALNECHNRKSGKIMHRDLKPANIFLDGENNVKLGDFGLSRMMGDQSVFAQTHVGTPYYMSPEQINEKEYDEKSDIWSAGCLLYEIAALRPPFEATNHLSLAMKIRAGRFDRLPLRYSEELQKLIEIMLNANPERRPSAENLLKFPLFDMRIKEKRLREKLVQVKQIEEEIKKKEEELKKIEINLAIREKKITIAELERERISTKPERPERKSIGYTMDKENKVNNTSFTGTTIEDYKLKNKYSTTQPVNRLSRRTASTKDRPADINISMTQGRRSSSKEFRNLPYENRNMSVTYKKTNSSFRIENYDIYNRKVF